MENTRSHIAFFSGLIALPVAYANYAKATAFEIVLFLVLLVLLFVFYERLNHKQVAEGGTPAVSYLFRFMSLCVLLWFGYAIYNSQPGKPNEVGCSTTTAISDVKTKTLSQKEILSAQIKEFEKKIEAKTKSNPNASTLELDLSRNQIEFKRNKLDSLSEIIGDSIKINKCVSKSFINHINSEYEKINSIQF